MAPLSPSEELAYLKGLVNQLNDKIKGLEEKSKKVLSPPTPAEQLRMILIGPPGAGALTIFMVSVGLRSYSYVSSPTHFR